MTMATLSIPVGARVTHAAHPGVMFVVDEHGRGGEYGLTVDCIGGACIWALPSDVAPAWRIAPASDPTDGDGCAVWDAMLSIQCQRFATEADAIEATKVLPAKCQWVALQF